MTSQSQKIAIVTGANNGIGFETTIGMVEAGYHVVMACRSREKAEKAKASITKQLPSASLGIMLVDLGDFASVRSFAEKFGERYEHLDVLINNAGILAYSKRENADGIELQFATNHLGHFLLTALLIDMMPDDPASRVVALSSIAHKGACIRFDDLSCGGNGGTAYGQSKLACLMSADELNRRLKAAGRKITALAVHPGGSDSGLFDEMSGLQYYALKLLSPFITHSNASAAKPSLHAALDASVAGGDYFGPQGLMEMRGSVGHAKRDPISEDKAIAKHLWERSEQLVAQEFEILPAQVQDNIAPRTQ